MLSILYVEKSVPKRSKKNVLLKPTFIKIDLKCKKYLFKLEATVWHFILSFFSVRKLNLHRHSYLNYYSYDYYFIIDNSKQQSDKVN